MAKRRERNTGLPYKFLMKDYDVKLLDKEIYKNVEKFIKNFDCDKPRNLFIMGSSGTGKTHLLTHITNEIIENKLIPYNGDVYERNGSEEEKLFCRFILSSDLLDIFWDDKEMFELISNVYLLIIDDINKIIPLLNENRFKVKLDKLLRCRYHKNLPSFYTSQYTIKQNEQDFGDSINSIIMDNAEVFKLVGKNMRITIN